MPVFDFKNASKESSFECTYTTFSSDNKTASPEHPIFVLDNSEHNWAAETIGMFANPYKKTAFEFQTDDGNILSNIIKVDARFTSLIKWLGENRIKVKLSGKNVEDGYAVLLSDENVV
jgi:ATP-dependent Lon protease